MSSVRVDVVILVFEDGGGMSHYARNLARGLREHCAVEIAGIGDDDGLTQGPLACGLDSFHIGRRLRRVYNGQRFRRIVRDLCERYAPAVVHVVSAVPCMGSVVAELRRLGIKSIHTIHDPAPHPQKRSQWSRLQMAISMRWLWPRTLKRFDALHVHSSKHHELLAAAYPSLRDKSFYVVQHGAGATKEVMTGSLTPPELRTTTDRRRSLLFFGRLEHYKGLDVLFEAMVRVAKTVPECRLIVAGAGQWPMVPDAIRSNVIAVNRFIADEEIAPIFKAASFVVLPYRSGTQTGVIPLASTFALPAVVTRVGALDELVEDGETGYVVNPVDPAALASAIECLLLAPDRAAAMGRAARRFMEEQYSWPRVAGCHWAHYDQLKRKGGVNA